MAKPAIRSNLEQWKELQDDNYFEKHPCYQGLSADDGAFDVGVVEQFLSLDGISKTVVVGCGYGRESLHLGRRVGHVYGIDVSHHILDKAVAYTSQNGVDNFTPVLAEEFERVIPDGIDLVYSMVVFQHLTRDLTRRYLDILSDKLAPGGRMVLQFCEDFQVRPDNDADLTPTEPSVAYTLRQIVDLAEATGLKLLRANSLMATETCLWHWVVLGPVQGDPAGHRDGRASWRLDLAAPYQNYGPDGAVLGGMARLNTGVLPWAYVAGVGIGVSPADGVLEVQLTNQAEEVYLFLVDEAYAPIGKRVLVRPREPSQRVLLPLSKDTPPTALVVQAGASPAGSPLTLEIVCAYLDS